MKRSVVAIVHAQPETVSEATARALRLAGAEARGAWPPPVRVVVGERTKAWQLDAALDWLGRTRVPVDDPLLRVHATPPGERMQDPARDPALARVFAAKGRTLAEAGPRARPVTVEGLPRLRQLRDEPLAVAPEFDRASLLLLAGALRSRRGILRGATEMLCATVGAADEAADAEPELRADLVELALAATERRWVLYDVSLLDGDGTWERPTIENLLLASDDPIACDATLCRLVLGVDPARIGWLRRCAERGLGAIERGGIRVVGDLDLVEDSVVGSERLPARGRRRRAGGLERMLHSVDPRRAVRAARRRLWRRAFARTPWGLLHASYVRGVEPRSEDRS